MRCCLAHRWTLPQGTRSITRSRSHPGPDPSMRGPRFPLTKGKESWADRAGAPRNGSPLSSLRLGCSEVSVRGAVTLLNHVWIPGSGFPACLGATSPAPALMLQTHCHGNKRALDRTGPGPAPEQGEGSAMGGQGGGESGCWQQGRG